MSAQRAWTLPRIVALILIEAAIYWIEPRVGRQTDESVPFHQYFIVDGAVRKGDYVNVEVREALINPNKPALLTKRIACMPGERLEFHGGRHFCNGVPLGKVLTQTLRRQRLTPFVWQGPIPPGKVFIAGSHPRSFDSRYFGFVDASRVRKVWPLF